MAPMTPRVDQHGNYFSARLQNYKGINARLLKSLERNIGTGTIHGSHFFDGRYENLYIHRRHAPEVEPILRFATDSAASVLRQAPKCLRCGFWFNHMRSGDVTGRHSHDEGDELLSGVYYLSVPKGTSPLILHANSEQISVAPIEGDLLLFDPALEHEVIAAQFLGVRVSIGMNFGIPGEDWR